MTRKLFIAGLFLLGCSATLYAAGIDEAPAPREVKRDDPKKAEPGKLRAKLAEKFGGRLDPERMKALREKLGKVDLDKLMERAKGVDAAKIQNLIEKFQKGDVDLETLKELKGLLKKPGE